MINNRTRSLRRTAQFDGNLSTIFSVISASLPRLDITKFGLADYSFYEGVVDWAKAKASGQSRVVIRVGQGYYGVDSQFINNATRSKGVFPSRDFYWVLDSRQSANGQARACMAALQQYGNTDADTILFADFELPNMTPDFLYGFLATCASIDPKLQLGIYTGYSFWATYGSADPKYSFQKYKLWIAWPTSPYVEPKPLAPWGSNWYYHQWTFAGDGAFYGAQSVGIDLSYRNPLINPTPLPPPPPNVHEVLETRQLFDGAVYNHMVAHYDRGDINYHIIEIDTTKATFEVSPFTNSVKYVPSSLLNNGYDIAVNGDGWHWDTSGLVMAGASMSNGTPYGTKGTEEAFYITKDNKFSLTKPAAPYNSLGIPNVLIENGVRRPVVATRLDTDPRTASGWSADGIKFYLMTVDGVETYNSLRTGMNYPEVCEVFEMWGVMWAFMHDGGGSSTMVMNELGVAKILNNPCGEDVVSAYGGAHLRAVANVFGIRMKSNVPVPQGGSMYKVIAPVTPRKTPSMFETSTLPELQVGYLFDSSGTVSVPQTINGTTQNVTFRQMPNTYWVPEYLWYKNTKYIEPVVPAPAPTWPPYFILEDDQQNRKRYNRDDSTPA